MSGKGDLASRKRILNLLSLVILLEETATWEGRIRFADQGVVISPVRYEHFAFKVNPWQLGESAQEVAKQMAKDAKIFLSNRTWSKGLADHFAKRANPMLATLHEEGKLLKTTVLRMEQRQRRSLGALLTLAGSLFSVGSSIYTLTQVHSLHSAVEAEAHNIQINHRDIQKIKEVMIKILKKEEGALLELETLTDFRWRIKKMVNHLRSVRAGLQKLRSHELPVGLLRERELEMVENKLPYYNRTRPNFAPREAVLMAPVSWKVKDKEVTVVLHVPTVSEPAKMIRKLYRLTGASLPHEHGTVRFVSPEPFISVADDQKTHVPISSADLDLCYRKGRVFLCEQLTILYKKPMSCIAALFFQKTGMATDRCNMELTSEPVPVLQVAPHTYLMNKDQTLEYECGNYKPKILELHRTKEMKFIPSCLVKGRGFTIYPLQDIDEGVRDVEHKLDWKSVFSSTNPQLDALKLKLMRIGTTKLEDMTIPDTDIVDWIIWICVAIFILLIIVVVVVAVYYFYRVKLVAGHTELFQGERKPRPFPASAVSGEFVQSTLRGSLYKEEDVDAIYTIAEDLKKEQQEQHVCRNPSAPLPEIPKEERLLQTNENVRAFLQLKNDSAISEEEASDSSMTEKNQPMYATVHKSFSTQEEGNKETPV